MRVEARVIGHGKVNPDDYLTLDHIQASSKDYSGRRLRKYTSISSRFERCRFDDLQVKDASFGAGKAASEYLECTFDGMQIEFGTGLVRFVGCSFRNVKLKRWLSTSGEFVDCVFTGRLDGCVFFGAVPGNERAWVERERNEFRGNDFSNCELVDSAFRTGIDLTEQCLPKGPGYLYLGDAVNAIAHARAAVLGWCDPALRESGLRFLKGLELDVAGGQRQILLRPGDFTHVCPKEVVDGVVAALRKSGLP